MAIGIHHPGGAVTFSCEVIPGAQWGQNRFKVLFEFYCLVLLQVPKCFFKTIFGLAQKFF